MKTFLLGVVVGALGLFAYQRAHQPAAVPKPESTLLARPDEPEPLPESDPSRFRCDGRIYCSQMTSCDEAKYFLSHCPGVKMDNEGHGDGVPCESQWCKGE